MLVRDAHKLCRLCLTSGTELIDIFRSSSTTDWTPSLEERIHLCLPVKVYPTDIFPTKLCLPCLESVNKLYTFWLQTESSQKRLHELFSTGSRIQSDKNDHFVGRNLTPDSVDGNPLVRTSKGDEPVTAVSCQLLQQQGSVCCDTADISSNWLKMDKTSDVPLQTERKRETFKCQFCPDALESDSLLRKHIKDCHSPFVCHCGAKFTSKRYLSKHGSRHTAYPKVPCKLCGKAFLNNTELKDHMKSHNVGEKLSCNVCSYVTLYASNLSRHMKRHEKKFALFCETCNAGFYDKDELATHRIKIHGDEPFFCETCHKSFARKNNLTCHMKTTHWTTNKDFLCETCGKAFKTRRATKRHMQIHMGLSFSCDVCHITVSSSCALKKHLKIHSGIKDVVCYVCGKAFGDIKYMAAHLRSHTGERPHECKECGKKFTQHTSLSVHMRYHTGERPFVCCVCGAGYVTKTLLKAHENHHSKEMKTKEAEPPNLVLVRLREQRIQLRERLIEQQERLIHQSNS